MGGEGALFARALDRIETWPGIHVTTASRIYRTEPQGDPDQPWFSNQVAALSCGPDVAPEGLLEDLLQLETGLGRSRDPARRYGPRRIDLDLLLFNDIICVRECLILPHPRMIERAFVLVPLLEIAPDLRLPDGTPAARCLAGLAYREQGEIIFQTAP